MIMLLLLLLLLLLLYEGTLFGIRIRDADPARPQYTPYQQNNPLLDLKAGALRAGSGALRLKVRELAWWGQGQGTSRVGSRSGN